MNGPEILFQRRLFASYTHDYNFYLCVGLAHGMPGDEKTAIPKTYKRTTTEPIGSTPIYRKTVETYDPSIDFTKLRNQWVAESNGVIITDGIEIITSAAGSVKNGKARMDAAKADAVAISTSSLDPTQKNAKEEKMLSKIKAIRNSIEVMSSKNSADRRLVALRRNLGFEIQQLQNLRSQINRVPILPQPVQPQTQPVQQARQPITQAPVQQTRPPLTQAPVQLQAPIVRPSKIIQSATIIESSDSDSEDSDQDDFIEEPQELTDAREQLSAERMGSNNMTTIQRLRAVVTNLEFKLAADRKKRKEEPAELSSDKVFEYLKILQWRDKDEQVLTGTVLNRIKIPTLTAMFPVMQKLAADLQAAIGQTTGAVESLSDSDRNNFLFHVIAKGSVMYYQSICEPDFCLFMLDSWQPLYTFMTNALNDAA